MSNSEAALCLNPHERAAAPAALGDSHEISSWRRHRLPLPPTLAAPPHPAQPRLPDYNPRSLPPPDERRLPIPLYNQGLLAVGVPPMRRRRGGTDTKLAVRFSQGT
jgi:hypothetical protein